MCRIVLIILIINIICINGKAEAAFGPIQQNVIRADGLCACLVLTVPGYGCREYMVQTEDQFILGLQRVSKLGYTGKPKGPVLVLHGILLGGDIWLLNSPDASLGFLLADEGYDVWIANTRTTRFSYGHVHYTKKDKEYWEWSVDELAQYDVPAMFGLVNHETNQKVNFVGFSQGTQQTFIALSEGSLKQDIVEKMVFLAPVAYVNHVIAPIAQLAASFYIDKLYTTFGIYEFSTQLQKEEIVDMVCQNKQVCYKDWINIFTGENCCVNLTRRAIINSYETQSTSTKNLQHMSQHYRQKTFAKFDYGVIGNMLRYGWYKPPPYDLSKVLASENTLFIYAAKDGLSDPKDVGRLFSELSSVGSYPVKFLENYAHMDFVLGTNAKSFVYDEVMQFLSL